MNRFGLLIILCAVIAPVGALANAPIKPLEALPVHPERALEQRKKQAEEQKKQTEARIKSIKSDLSNTQKDMVALASKMTANEATLTHLNADILARKKEQIDIEARLDKDKGTISDLVLAKLRLDRVPPQALLARPDKPYQTAQSAMILQSVLPSIYERAEQLRADQANLARIIAELEEKEKRVMATSKSLSAQESKLSKLMNKRRTLLSQNTQDYKQQTTEMKIISAQAQTLKELMVKIEKKQKQAEKRAKELAAQEASRRAQERAKTQKASLTSGSRAVKNTPIPVQGKPQLPAAGIIDVRYGAVDNIGAKSEGIKIKARSGGLVVAPMGGVVEYAGPFRSYGNILLIKHAGHYMSLIAGLGDINAAVGQSVKAGEPIGRINVADGAKNNGDAKQSSLYYELRFKGNPVNPSKKIAGL